MFPTGGGLGFTGTERKQIYGLVERTLQAASSGKPIDELACCGRPVLGPFSTLASTTSWSKALMPRRLKCRGQALTDLEE